MKIWYWYAPLLSFSNGSWCNSDGGHGTAVWWWWWWLSWWCTWWCPSMPWWSPALPSCTGWWNDADDACCNATLWWSEPVDDTKSCKHRLGSVRFSKRSIIFDDSRFPFQRSVTITEMEKEIGLTLCRNLQ